MPPDTKQRLSGVTPYCALQAQQAMALARAADNLGIEITAAGILDAFDQGRSVPLDEMALVKAYVRSHGW
jgi:hypothetical protein